MNEQRTTPLKAIRAKCLDCSCGSAAEVRECVIPTCPLFPFRMGHNPNIKLTDEQRQQRADNLRKIPKNMGKESHNSRSKGNYPTETENAGNATQDGKKGAQE